MGTMPQALFDKSSPIRLEPINGVVNTQCAGVLHHPGPLHLLGGQLFWVALSEKVGLPTSRDLADPSNFLRSIHQVCA